MTATPYLGPATVVRGVANDPAPRITGRGAEGPASDPIGEAVGAPFPRAPSTHVGPPRRSIARVPRPFDGPSQPASRARGLLGPATVTPSDTGVKDGSAGTGLPPRPDTGPKAIRRRPSVPKTGVRTKRDGAGSPLRPTSIALDRQVPDVLLTKVVTTPPAPAVAAAIHPRPLGGRARAAPNGPLARLQGLAVTPSVGHVAGLGPKETRRPCRIRRAKDLLAKRSRVPAPTGLATPAPSPVPPHTRVGGRHGRAPPWPGSVGLKHGRIRGRTAAVETGAVGEETVVAEEGRPRRAPPIMPQKAKEATGAEITGARMGCAATGPASVATRRGAPAYLRAAAGRVATGPVHTGRLTGVPQARATVAPSGRDGV